MGFPPGGGGGGPWGYAGGPSGFATVMPAAFGPAGQAVMSEREVRLQKRKQVRTITLTPEMVVRMITCGNQCGAPTKKTRSSPCVEST